MIRVKCIVHMRHVLDFRFDVVADCDLIGINEAFDEELSATLIDGFNEIPDRQFAFARSPEPKSMTQFASGGLILFSRFPIVTQKSMTFSNGSRLITSGFKSADGVAAKGAIFARIRLPWAASSRPDTPLHADCFLTHLESNSSEIRAEQLAELAEFVRANRTPGSLLLLMGDFNITGPSQLKNLSEGEYAQMRKLLKFDSTEIRDLAIAPLGMNDKVDGSGTSDALSTESRRIDYLLFGQPTGQDRTYSSTFKTLPLLDENVPEGSLSDHAAVWARLEF